LLGDLVLVLNILEIMEQLYALLVTILADIVMETLIHNVLHAHWVLIERLFKLLVLMILVPVLMDIMI